MAGQKKAPKKKSNKHTKTRSKVSSLTVTEGGIGDIHQTDIQNTPLRVWLPGMPLEEGEELQADPSAYVMLHSFSLGWPCLSFDFISTGKTQTGFPLDLSVVSGTQAGDGMNEVLVVNWSNITNTLQEDSDHEDEEEYVEPLMKINRTSHDGGVNRVRHNGRLAATWSDTGVVHIWDTQRLLNVASVNEHGKEGYSLAWNKNLLLSGDCSGAIILTDITNGTTTKFNSTHTASVEDIHWSPVEATVFASASVDGTVAIWDTRLPALKPALQHRLHACDINVLSWNPVVQYLLATGADDGTFASWDLRNWMSNTDKIEIKPLTKFEWHKVPITSIEWHPTDASVLAVSAADDQLTIWDFSVERDPEATLQMDDHTTNFAEFDESMVPQQLLFIHHQKEVKELHWSKEADGVIVSTGSEGFNVFKTISI